MVMRHSHDYSHAEVSVDECNDLPLRTVVPDWIARSADSALLATPLRAGRRPPEDDLNYG